MTRELDAAKQIIKDLKAAQAAEALAQWKAYVARTGAPGHGHGHGRGVQS